MLENSQHTNIHKMLVLAMVDVALSIFSVMSKFC